MEKLKLLFICTFNMSRSPTAEDLFVKSEIYDVKSAGLAPVAVKKVTQDMIDWADKIFIMSERNDKHLTLLKSDFNINNKLVYDLDINDVYERNDPILIQILKDKLTKNGIKV
jgi:predicted protein tyrosine phosphatase